jgi:hypothetical protein
LSGDLPEDLSGDLPGGLSGDLPGGLSGDLPGDLPGERPAEQPGPQGDLPGQEAPQEAPQEGQLVRRAPQESLRQQREPREHFPSLHFQGVRRNPVAGPSSTRATQQQNWFYQTWVFLAMRGKAAGAYTAPPALVDVLNSAKRRRQLVSGALRFARQAGPGAPP